MQIQVCIQWDSIYYRAGQGDFCDMLCLGSTAIDTSLENQIAEQKRRLRTGEAAITSHTILVVDQSTSMNSGDVMGHRSRSRGVFYTVANEMVATPLLKNIMTFTDVVTLIEMRSTPSIHDEIHFEPITWQLHNKFVALASKGEALRAKGKGNYIPALNMALQIFNSMPDQNCALNLFFLSDGRPSDGGRHLDQRINAIVTTMGRTIGDRLTFGTFGFANNDDGEMFRTLESMAETARNSGCGSRAIFSSGLDSSTLRAALYTATSSLISTRKGMSSLAGGSLLRVTSTPRAKRQGIVKDKANIVYGGDIFIAQQFNFMMVEGVHQLKRYVMEWERGTRDIDFQPVPLRHPSAAGIAMKMEYIESGAERVCYQLTEVDRNRNPVGQPLVAKISVFEDDDQGQMKFHTRCARTQLESRRLARVFNKSLDAKQIQVPRIEFLEPSFYDWISANTGAVQAILVEKRLDISRYKKWNDNRGGVDTLLARVQPVLLPTEIQDRKDSNKDCESDESEEEEEEPVATAEPEHTKIIDDDVPPAFSHFTFQYTISV
jgi:hypothetical protein